jgi:hypothetical protein
MIGGMHGLGCGCGPEKPGDLRKPGIIGFLGEGQVAAVGHALACEGGLQIIDAFGHFRLLWDYFLSTYIKAYSTPITTLNWSSFGGDKPPQFVFLALM